MGRAALLGSLIACVCLLLALSLGRTDQRPVSPLPDAPTPVIALRTQLRVPEDRVPANRVVDERADVAPAPPPEVERDCPDLERTVDGFAESLRERTRTPERDWQGDCLAVAWRLDEHCAQALQAMGEDPTRDESERLAALSLAAVDPRLADGMEFDAATRAWLWQRVRTGCAWNEDPPDPYRSDAAAIAALCLEWCGGAPARARLALDLRSETCSRPAVFAMARARHPDVGGRLLDALEADVTTHLRAARVLASSCFSGCLPFSAAERELAIESLVGVLRDGLELGCTNEDLVANQAALGALDPRGACGVWAERVDRVGSRPGEVLWSVPAMFECAWPGNAERVNRLLSEGPPSLRAEVASLVLRQIEASGEFAVVRRTSLDLLVALAWDAQDSSLFRQALLGIQRAHHFGAEERAAVERLAMHPDPERSRRAREVLDLRARAR